MDRVRLGMVGSRFAARTHLANNFAKLRGFKMEVAGIASKTEASAQQAAREFNIPFVYTDYRKLLDRKDVDVIDICSPTNLHEEMIIEAALKRDQDLAFQAVFNDPTTRLPIDKAWAMFNEIGLPEGFW